MASSAPDVVLLDVQMPEVDGFRVAEAALRLGGDAVPIIIFVTAFDAHAVRAFDVGAADYLLKPVETTRFARALARARQVVGVADAAARARDLARVLTAHAGTSSVDAPIAPPAPARAFAVRVGTREVRVPADEIAWVEADDYCAVLHNHDGRRHVIRETLQSLEEQLESAAFVRVHRSALVRRSAIVALERHGLGQLRVVLRDGTRVGRQPLTAARGGGGIPGRRLNGVRPDRRSTLFLPRYRDEVPELVLLLVFCGRLAGGQSLGAVSGTRVDGTTAPVGMTTARLRRPEEEELVGQWSTSHRHPHLVSRAARRGGAATRRSRADPPTLPGGSECRPVSSLATVSTPGPLAWFHG
jgi:two-component system LytT family response regulator